MKKYILLICLSFFGESSFCQSSVSYPESFTLLNDFILNKSLFKEEIVDWGSKEGDYGLLWKSDQRSYRVYDLAQFRNRARITILYVVDKDMKLKIVRRIADNYDKEWNDPTKTIKTTEEYYVFDGGSFKRLGSDLKEISNSSNDNIRKEIESLFKAATQSK